MYFPDSNKLNEYVLNDSGVIFNGDANYIGQKPWFYGQVSHIYATSGKNRKTEQRHVTSGLRAMNDSRKLQTDRIVKIFMINAFIATDAIHVIYK